MAYFSERMNPKTNVKGEVFVYDWDSALSPLAKKKKNYFKTEELFSPFKASYLTSILLIHCNLFLELIN